MRPTSLLLIAFLISFVSRAYTQDTSSVIGGMNLQDIEIKVDISMYGPYYHWQQLGPYGDFYVDSGTGTQSFLQEPDDNWPLAYAHSRRGDTVVLLHTGQPNMSVSFILDSVNGLFRSFSFRTTGDGGGGCMYYSESLWLQMRDVPVVFEDGAIKMHSPATWGQSVDNFNYSLEYDCPVPAHRASLGHASSDSLLAFPTFIFKPSTSNVERQEEEKPFSYIKLNGGIRVSFAPSASSRVLTICDVLGRVLRSVNIAPESTAVELKLSDLAAQAFILKLGTQTLKILNE
jgi:hypothetical protein